MSLIPEGTLNEIAITATDTDGFYQLLIVDDDLPSGFDSDNDEVQVKPSLTEAAHDPSRFQIVVGVGFLTALLSDPFVLGDECGTAGVVERDFYLGAIPDEYEASTPDEKDHWDDIGEIYHLIHNATRLADLLHQPLDNGNPMAVNAFATGVFDAADDAAYWCGNRSNGEICSELTAFIAFGDSATLLSDPNWPDNREYHEFGHHFLADAFADAAPASAANTNHAGYYRNPSSSDSWVEGFAEFYSLMVSKHIDQDPLPDWYLDWYSLEFDFRPWFAAGGRRGAGNRRPIARPRGRSGRLCAGSRPARPRRRLVRHVHRPCPGNGPRR